MELAHPREQPRPRMIALPYPGRILARGSRPWRELRSRAVDEREQVVDEQYLRHDQSGCAICGSGSRTLMRVPASTLLSMEIVPPCNSTAFLAMTMPSPVPWRLPTLEAR